MTTEIEALALSLSQSIDHITWCTTSPHRIDQILGIRAEGRTSLRAGLDSGKTNEQLIDAFKAQDYGSGGLTDPAWSDPTSQAALRNEPDAIDDDDPIMVAVLSIKACAVEIDDWCTTTVPAWSAPPDGAPMLAQLGYAKNRLGHAAPRLAAAWSDLGSPRDDDARTGFNPRSRHNHAEYVIRTDLEDTASWLRIKAEGIWLASKGETLQVAVQKPIAECTCCGKWRSGTIAVSKGLCDPCLMFQQREHCRPSEAIVKRWEYGQAATPGQIMEAKAAAKARPRKAKTA